VISPRAPLPAQHQSHPARKLMNGIPGLMPPNRDAGVSWFRKAAAQGDPDGIRNLEAALGSGTLGRP